MSYNIFLQQSWYSYSGMKIESIQTTFYVTLGSGGARPRNSLDPDEAPQNFFYILGAN